MNLRNELNFPSRFFLAPINTGYSKNGNPTQELERFFLERSGKMIGATYVGNVAVATELKSNAGTATINVENLPIWNRLALGIETRGSVPAIQLASKHAGIESESGWVNQNVQDFVDQAKDILHGLSREQIFDVCKKYIAAAQCAEKAGFKIVQIHSAHGYLLAMLLNRIINDRTDEFGDGTFALRHLSKEIAKVCKSIVLDVRVSLFDGIEELDSEVRYRRQQISELSQSGYEMISLSAGMYDVDRRMIYPGQDTKEPYVSRVVELAEEFSEIHWNVAGRLGSLLRLQESVRENVSFSICRPLIADPEFIEKSLTGKEDEINQCKFTSKCHYFSRGKEHIECGVNESV